MSDPHLGAVVRHIRRLALPPETHGLTDLQLLDRFRGRREEGAFAALMQRHGGLVWGVCRHLLRQEQDAEDAFQATFLVLARKAGSIRKGEALGSWLHGTAFRIAMKARREAGRRRAREAQAEPAGGTAPAPEAGWQELQAALDEEAQRLPPRERAAFVLCALEGKTQPEAAAALGWTRGTVASTLARARGRLRSRLAARGITLSALLTGLAVSGRPADAAPAALAGATLRAAVAADGLAGVSARVAALTEGAMKELVPLKLKVLAAILVLSAAVGWGTAYWPAAEPKPPDPPTTQPPNRPTTRPPKDGEAEEARAESPLPAGALARLGTSRFRHSFGVHAVAVSPDGKLIASGSNNETIRLWETDSGREVRVLTGHTAVITGLAFSPDGKTLASSSWDGTARLWDVAGGNAIRTLNGHGGGVQSVAFSQDGKKVVTASYDRTARVWEFATGKELLQLQGHDAAVDCAVFSHDGKLIATSSEDKTVRLWDAEGGKEVRKLEGHVNRVRRVAFSPDDKRLASGGWDTTARLWEVSTGKPLGKIQLSNGIESVEFSPDGKALATACGRDDRVRVFDLTGDGGKQRWQAPIGLPFAITFSQDGKKVVAGGWDSRVRVWDAATGQESAASRGTGHSGWVNGVSFLPDRKTLISSSDDGAVILWDVGRGNERQRLHTPTNRSWCLAVAPDGKTFATGGHEQAVSVWDAATAKAVATIKVRGAVRAVAFSPDGKKLVAASDESLHDGSAPPVTGNGAAIWELATGKLVTRLEGHEGGVRAVAWSSDGKFIATGGADHTMRLWDAATGKEQRKMEGAAQPINAVAFSPDSKVVAWGAEEGTTRLLRLPGEDEPVALPANGAVLALAFSPDSRTLATATRRVRQVEAAVRLWDVTTAKERARFPEHQQSAASLAFSPDGRVLASGGTEGTVLLWDVTGRVKDGKFATADLPPPSLEGEWAELTGDDGFKVHRAIWALAAAPKQVLPLLREHLKPVPPGAAERIAQLIKDLDNDDFDIRDKASAELERVGEPAEAALRKALEGAPSAELRARANQLLEKFAGKVVSAEILRRGRALEVLEYIGGPEARAVLEEIAKGAPQAALTREAKAALKRLGQ